MKPVIILFAIAIATASASQFILNDAALDKVKLVTKGCQQKAHIDDDVADKIRNNVSVDDEKAKTYNHCIFTEMNWIKDDSFQIEEFKKDIKEDLPFDVIEQCSRFRSTGLQLSYNINKCIAERIAAYSV